MRVLLDTNILIHRETTVVLRDDIGDVFSWLDRINAQKCVHPQSIVEIRRHRDSHVVRTFEAKLRSYHELRTIAADTPEITTLRNSDRSVNDSIDTDLLREVYASRVDLLLSEDGGIHRKASILGIADKVLRIDDFLARVIRDNPGLVDYSVLAVKKEYFGNLDLADPFFDTFKRDYQDFANWFTRKADEIAYVCLGAHGDILAFLYLKIETKQEPYNNIVPVFTAKRRLKIGTFKVAASGLKLGERFLKVIFDNALASAVAEIYVTIFSRTVEQKGLIAMLEYWGFVRHGKKSTEDGEEGVWVKEMSPTQVAARPAHSFPFMSRNARKFIVPIYPEYHTELFPDSILKTESPMDYVENRPHRNALRKVYISRSYFRELITGDIIVFYRTRDSGPAHYTAVATTLGIVESVRDNLEDFDSFRRACVGISVFSDDKLLQHWNYNPQLRPFVVRFLCTYSLPRRPNLAQLKEHGVVVEHPRGFERLRDEGFVKLLEISNARSCPLVD